MSETSSLPTAQLVAFYGRATPLRPEALATAVRDRCRALARGADKLLAMTELMSPADAVFARQALDLRIPLLVVLPVSRDKLKKESAPDLWTEFESILDAAAQVEVAPDAPALDSGRRLADDADVLLVFETDSAPAKETGPLIEYAQRQGREIFVIRENPASADETRLQPNQALPEVKMDALVAMLDEPPAVALCPAELIQYSDICSQEADRIAPVYRKYFFNVVLANAIAAMAGTVQVVFVPSHISGLTLQIPGGIPVGALARILICIKFGCVALGAIIFLILQIRKSQNRWINARLKAEMCRSARTTWRLPRLTDALAMGGQPAARGTLQFIRYVRAVNGIDDDVTLPKFKADYGVNRIRDQYRYYKKQADKASTMSRRLTPFYWVLTALSIVAALASLLYPHLVSRHGEPPVPGTWPYFVLGFIPIMAPAFASWILAWEAIETLGRRKARYREMQENLHRALADLVQAETWDAVGNVVERTEKMLLSEVLEWYSFIKYSK